MSNLTTKNEMLKNLKNKMAEVTWKSSFDFESFEIDSETKKFIELREEKIVNSFKKYSLSKFELCTALAEVKTKLFEKGDSFMAWYENLGFTKDKVSELLKTYELYIQAPHLKDYISSLSGLAVRILTNKNVNPQLALELMEKGIKNTSELKELLIENKQEDYDQELQEKVVEKNNNNFGYTLVAATNDMSRRIEITDSQKELSELKKEINYFKKIFADMEKKVLEREKEYENKNNLRMPI